MHDLKVGGVPKRVPPDLVFVDLFFMIWMDAKTRDLKIGGVPKRTR